MSGFHYSGRHGRPVRIQLYHQWVYMRRRLRASKPMGEAGGPGLEPLLSRQRIHRFTAAPEVLEGADTVTPPATSRRLQTMVMSAPPHSPRNVQFLCIDLGGRLIYLKPSTSVG